MTEETSIDIEELANYKIALFIITSDTDTSLDPLIKLIYRQIMGKLLAYADLEEDGMLARHVRFILDDFASGCIMDGFQNIIANARSRNISFTLCIQSLAQLESLYGKIAKSIMECINYKVYFPSANFETQQYIARLLNCPVEDVQIMPADKICLERIYDKPRIIERINDPSKYIKIKPEKEEVTIKKQTDKVMEKLIYTDFDTYMEDLPF